MAFALVQAAVGTNSGFSNVTTFSCTFGAAITSGNAVLAAGQYDNGSSATVVSVTDDKGNIYNVVDTLFDSTDNQNSFAFYLNNLTNSPTTITVTLSSPSAFTGVNAEEWSGITTGSALVGHTATWNASKSTATDAMSSGTMTPTTNGALIWGATITTDSTNTVVHGTGFTAGTAGPSAGPMLFEYLTQATAASIAATYTASVGSMQTVYVMAFAPVSTAKNINLTGVHGSGGEGTPIRLATFGLTGRNGTGAVGTLRSFTFGGIGGVGGIGSFAPILNLNLTSSAGSGGVGTLQRPFFVGNSGIGGVGGFTLGVKHVLGGLSGTGASGTLRQQFFIGQNGTGASGSFGKTIARPLVGNVGIGGSGVLARPAHLFSITGVAGFGGINRFHNFDPAPQKHGIFQLFELQPNTTYTITANASVYAAPTPTPAPSPSPSPVPSGAATMFGSTTAPAVGPTKSGFALVANYAMGSGPNTDGNGRTVTSRSVLDSITAKRFVYGAGDNTSGYDILGDASSPVFWSAFRDYPDGDSRNLHPMSSSYLSLKGIIPTTAAGYDINGGLFWRGIYSAMIRFNTELDMTKNWYVEGRIQVSTGYGAWPAFWLNPGASPSLTWPPEIDIFEFFNWQGRSTSAAATSNIQDNGDPSAYGSALSYDITGGSGDYNGISGGDYGAAMHVYGMEWLPNDASENVKIYVDGVHTRSYTYKWIVSNTATIIVNNQIGINWATPPGPVTGGSDGMTTTSVNNMAMNIDYIRVYEGL